jgi:hypothetical protein
MAGKRHSPSSIDNLPQPIRIEIGRLIAANVTLDDIVAHLQTLKVTGEEEFAAPSRSALGRYAQNLRAAQEKINRSRAMAEAFASSIEEKPDDQVFRANLEILQSSIMQLLTAVEEDPETGEVSAVTFQAKEVQALAKAMQSVASAQKTDATRTLLMRQEIAKAAAKAVDKVAAQKGLGKDMRQALLDAALGVAA